MHNARYLIMPNGINSHACYVFLFLAAVSNRTSNHSFQAEYWTKQKLPHTNIEISFLSCYFRPYQSLTKSQWIGESINTDWYQIGTHTLTYWLHQMHQRHTSSTLTLLPHQLNTQFNNIHQIIYKLTCYNVYITPSHAPITLQLY